MHEGMRKLILIHLHNLGGRGTAREIATDLGKSLKIVWPRITELKEDGRIRDTGFVIRTKGRPLNVLALANTKPELDALHFETPKEAAEAFEPVMALL